MKHELPPVLVSGSKEERLKALRELKHQEIQEWLDRENRKVAKAKEITTK